MGCEPVARVAQAQGQDDRGRDDHREAEVHEPGHERVGQGLDVAEHVRADESAEVAHAS